MGILLIDCSSKKTEFGYFDNNGILNIEESDKKGLTDNLIFSIKHFFFKNEITIEDIDSIGLSNGPGSFTGLRVSSAIAKGICYSSGCRLIEVITLDVIANKVTSDKKIIPLVYSNSKTLEFYYSEYRKNENGLTRLSDYKIAKITDINLYEDSVFVINEEISFDIPDAMTDKLIDVSGETNIKSLNELTQRRISENKFSDYSSSVPFYMKNFVPKN